MRINDVSGNETNSSEDSETLDNTLNEALEGESSETETTVLYESYDYTPILSDIRGLHVFECVLLLAIGCIIAWTGARHE